MKNIIKKVTGRIESIFVWILFFNSDPVGQHGDLKDLKNKNIILLGNGPSVDIDDVIKFKRNKFVLFACNRYYLAVKKGFPQPDFICSSDEIMIDDFGPEMVAFGERNRVPVIFLVSRLRHLSLYRDNPNVLLYPSIKFNFKLLFGKSSLCPNGGGTLIGIGALISSFLPRSIYLYGVDHSFRRQKSSTDDLRTDDGNHFISNYRSGKSWAAPRTNTIEKGFENLLWVCRRYGIIAQNLTRESYLPIWPRKTVEEIFLNEKNKYN